MIRNSITLNHWNSILQKEVNKISIIKHWGDPKPLPTTITVDLTKESGWALGTRIDSCSRKECDQNVKIHLGYDAIKSMNLISNDDESEEPDGYSHMTSHKYEINLLPPEEGLSSPFETYFSSISTEEGIGETRRELAPSGQSKRPGANAKEKGILTVITQERTIRRAYFNDRKAPVTFDTCSNISTIEFDNPKRNRIMKVGKRLRMNHLCKENDTGKKGNIGAALKDDPRQSAR